MESRARGKIFHVVFEVALLFLQCGTHLKWQNEIYIYFWHLVWWSTTVSAPLLATHIFWSLKLMEAMHIGKLGNWNTLACHNQHWSSHIWHTLVERVCGVCPPISNSAMLRKIKFKHETSDSAPLFITDKILQFRCPWCLIFYVTV